MTTQINKHVFHGFYSNFGYRPDFTHNQRLASVPIHFFRASSGELENEIVKEFESEEEVLKWYKKNKYGEFTYNELKFPDDFCKNYIIISESELSKYKNLFHGMIKGLKITSDIEIFSEGTAFSDSCPETKEDRKDGIDTGATAGPIVFNSPNGQPTYFTATGGADDDGFLNGKKITSVTAGPFDQSLIPKTKETTLSFTAVDTEGANVAITATVTWHTEIKYKQKINFSINFDSTKIFDFPEVQKRLSATDLTYITDIDLDENKNKEELEYNKKIFKDEWQFDQKEFKSIFENNKEKFNYNATLINDPVLLEQETSFNILNSKELNIILSHIFNGNSLSSESVDKQKNFEKKFDKFGSINYKIENENSIISSSNNYLNFNISNLFYIKNQKKYLLFIEIDHTVSLNGDSIDKEKDCDNDSNNSSSSSRNDQSPGSLNVENLNLVLSKIFDKSLSKTSLILSTKKDYMYLDTTNPFNIPYIFSTRDTLNLSPQTYSTSDCSAEGKELELKKTKCKIKLANNIFEIELFTLKNIEYIFDNSECQNLTPHFRSLIRNKLRFNIKKEPFFEILEWKDSDFNKANVFPPKLA